MVVLSIIVCWASVLAAPGSRSAGLQPWAIYRGTPITWCFANTSRPCFGDLRLPKCPHRELNWDLSHKALSKDCSLSASCTKWREGKLYCSLPATFHSWESQQQNGSGRTAMHGHRSWSSHYEGCHAWEWRNLEAALPTFCLGVTH